MLISTFIEILDTLLPKESAADFDKVGLQIQSGRADISKILVAFEINDEVIDEAIKNQCDSIIAFHPLIFHSLNYITETDRVGSLITKIIEAKIALFIAHTNFDAYLNGTSKILADALGIITTGFLEPDKRFANCGMGALGRFENPVEFSELLSLVSKTCKSPLKYSSAHKNSISTVAIVGGSGSSYIDMAIESKADVFITADISYHSFHKANGKIALIDPGHYEMEQFVIEGLFQLITNNFKDIYAIKSKSLTNPISYFPDSDLYKNMQLNNLL